MSSRDTALQGGAGGLRPAGLSAQDSGHDDQAHGHPTDRQYIRIAIILTIITIIEVAIYYIEGIRDFLVPMLIVLSLGKFIAVVAYFMHLKFDDRRYTVMFISGLVLSVAVIAALVIMLITAQYFPDVPSAPGSAAGH